MFTCVGVKINLDQFVATCKTLFATFESNLADYTTEWLKQNAGKGEDARYCVIEFLEDTVNHYFTTSDINRKIVLFEWDEHAEKDDIFSYIKATNGIKKDTLKKNTLKKNTSNTTIVFGISLLVCDKEAMKSLPFDQVNACVQYFQGIITQLGVDESEIELITDAI